MSMTQADLQADFKNAFLDDPFFGETVLVQEDRDATPYERTAVVHRGDASIIDGNGSPQQETRRQITVQISSKAADGVARIVKNQTVIHIKKNLSDTEYTAWKVADIISQDAGVWEVSLK